MVCCVSFFLDSIRFSSFMLLICSGFRLFFYHGQYSTSLQKHTHPNSLKNKETSYRMPIEYGGIVLRRQADYSTFSYFDIFNIFSVEFEKFVYFCSGMVDKDELVMGNFKPTT